MAYLRVSMAALTVFMVALIIKTQSIMDIVWMNSAAIGTLIGKHDAYIQIAILLILFLGWVFWRVISGFVFAIEWMRRH